MPVGAVVLFGGIFLFCKCRKGKGKDKSAAGGDGKAKTLSVQAQPKEQQQQQQGQETKTTGSGSGSSSSPASTTAVELIGIPSHALRASWSMLTSSLVCCAVPDTFKIVDMNPKSEEFYDLEDRFKASLNNHSTHQTLFEIVEPLFE